MKNKQTKFIQSIKITETSQVMKYVSEIMNYMINKIHPEPFNHFFVYQSSCQNWIGLTSFNFQHCSCFYYIFCAMVSTDSCWNTETFASLHEIFQNSFTLIVVSKFQEHRYSRLSIYTSVYQESPTASLWLPHTCLNTNNAGSDNHYY